MRFWIAVEDTSQLADAIRRENVLVVCLVGIEHPVNVEEEDVEQHPDQSRGAIKLAVQRIAKKNSFQPVGESFWRDAGGTTKNPLGRSRTLAGIVPLHPA